MGGWDLSSVRLNGASSYYQLAVSSINQNIYVQTVDFESGKTKECLTQPYILLNLDKFYELFCVSETPAIG
jgi:hypothetical protein